MGRFDSFLYAVSAYQVWQPEATADDLVSEKPAGQALLTGWCYRLWPGPPSRLTLVPIESAFLLGAYGVFWLLAVRLFGRRIAAVLTLLFVIALNTYNVNEGFNLNECYLALPVLLAVWAHLTIARPGRRGFVRGLGLGLSLAIKQTAVGLTFVCLLHGLAHVLAHKRYRPGTLAFAMTLIGIASAWAPIGLFLAGRGWLKIHLHDLFALSGRHVSTMPAALPTWDRTAPLAPFIWWACLGLFGWLVLRAGRLPRPRRGPDPEGEPPVSPGWALAFAGLWFAVEAAIIWAMVKPWAHYYQQIVAPAGVLAGFGMAAFARGITPIPVIRRLAIWRWCCATTAVLAMLAVMPLLAATSRSIHRFDRRAEVDQFAHWLEEWSARPIGQFFREVGHETRP